jgi:hypothetical protein
MVRSPPPTLAAGFTNRVALATLQLPPNFDQVATADRASWPRRRGGLVVGMVGLLASPMFMFWGRPGGASRGGELGS